VAATADCAPIREEVILQPGKSSILDLDFVPGHELGVTVLDDKGAPLPGAQVLLDPGADVALATSLTCGLLAPEEAFTQTDDDGLVRLEHVADGEYSVWALVPGYEPASATVTINGDEQEVRVTVKPPEQHPGQ
jgi:hypothetical protein